MLLVLFAPRRPRVCQIHFQRNAKNTLPLRIKHLKDHHSIRVSGPDMSAVRFWDGQLSLAMAYIHFNLKCLLFQSFLYTFG